MRVGVALGSNLGDRVAHLREAVASIRDFAEPPVLLSRIYETAPEDCPPGSPPFLNAAVEIGWSRDIHDLLRRLQEIERAHGRPSVRAANAPRPLDLDLLYADDLVIESPLLTLPHPRMMTRAFVQVPLNDLIPTQKIPGFTNTPAEQVRTLDISKCYRTQYALHQ